MYIQLYMHQKWGYGREYSSQSKYWIKIFGMATCPTSQVQYILTNKGKNANSVFLQVAIPFLRFSISFSFFCFYQLFASLYKQVEIRGYCGNLSSIIRARKSSNHSRGNLTCSARHATNGTRAIIIHCWKPKEQFNNETPNLDGELPTSLHQLKCSTTC